jgi:hypothetical protein
VGHPIFKRASAESRPSLSSGRCVRARPLQIGVCQPGGRAGQPTVNERFLESTFADRLQLNENRGVPIEMGDREEPPRLRGEYGFFFVEVADPDGKDGPSRWRGITEALQVGLAERALPGEALALDKPRTVAVSLAFNYIGQLENGSSHIVEGSHSGAVSPIVQAFRNPEF